MTLIIILIVLLVLGIAGRLFYGKVCPFGFLQELLYKIPMFKKERNLPHDELLRNLKYVILAFVIISIVLENVLPSREINKVVSLTIKVVGFSTIFILSIFSFRPFCKYFCPFGVILGLFNKLTPFKYKVDKDKCIKCNICKKECKMDIIPYNDIDSIECIRCGKCLKKCPKKAIESKLPKKRNS